MTLGIQPSWAKLLTIRIVKEILNIIQFVTIIFTYFVRHQGILCFSLYKTVSGLLKQNIFSVHVPTQSDDLTAWQTVVLVGLQHSCFSLLTHFRWLEKACYLIDLPPCSFFNISRLQIELYKAVYRSAVMRTILWPLL